MGTMLGGDMDTGKHQRIQIYSKFCGSFEVNYRAFQYLGVGHVQGKEITLHYIVVKNAVS